MVRSSALAALSTALLCSSPALGQGIAPIGPSGDLVLRDDNGVLVGKVMDFDDADGDVVVAFALSGVRDTSYARLVGSVDFLNASGLVRWTGAGCTGTAYLTESAFGLEPATGVGADNRLWVAPLDAPVDEGVSIMSSESRSEKL